MDAVEITENEIDVSKALTTLQNPTCGGTAIFIGTTRDHCDGKEVKTLFYEAYPSMALKQMHTICSVMKSKWSLVNVVLLHRIGFVPVCDVSVLVAATAVHRKDALEAVSFGIDAIKSDVFIWKREEYMDGSSNWKENCECKWSASHEKGISSSDLNS